MAIMPTDEQRAFWAAIRANPLDDTARLVYADWLQESGDEPRAEFIRVQIEQTSMFSPSALCSDPNERTLTKHEKRLISLHRERWLRPLYDQADTEECGVPRDDSQRHVKFARGFPRDISLPLRAACRLAAASSNVEPLEDVKIECGFVNDDWETPLITAVAQWADANCVTEIKAGDATDEFVKAMAEGCLTRLRKLDLHWCELTEHGAALLANWPSAATLQVLNLADSSLTDEGAIALAASPYLGHLKQLTISGLRLTPVGLDHLSAAFGDRIRIPS